MESTISYGYPYASARIQTGTNCSENKSTPILEDGDQQELLMALRRVANAFGGIPKLAGKAELNVTALYKTLSPQGNPELKGLISLLKAIGMRLAVAPIS